MRHANVSQILHESAAVSLKFCTSEWLWAQRKKTPTTILAYQQCCPADGTGVGAGDGLIRTTQQTGRSSRAGLVRVEPYHATFDDRLWSWIIVRSHKLLVEGNVDHGVDCQIAHAGSRRRVTIGIGNGQALLDFLFLMPTSGVLLKKLSRGTHSRKDTTSRSYTEQFFRPSVL